MCLTDTEWACLQQVVEFMFENYNVVLFALDVDVLDQEKQQRVRTVRLLLELHALHKIPLIPSPLA